MIKYFIFNLLLASGTFIISKIMIQGILQKKYPDLYEKMQIRHKSGFVTNSRFYSIFLYDIKNEKDQSIRVLKIIHLVSIPYVVISFILLVVLFAE